MLIEYIKASRGFTPLIYKLHYNPNVEQSMKGDDALLFDTANIMAEVICGEGKFRNKPTTKVLREIIDNLQGCKKFPASISFVANRLAEIGQKELADQITELQMAVFNGTVPVTNVGFFISKSSRCKDSGTSALVENNLDSTNPRLVMLSLGVDNPVEIVTKAFQRAEEILKTK